VLKVLLDSSELLTDYEAILSRGCVTAKAGVSYIVDACSFPVFFAISALTLLVGHKEDICPPYDAHFISLRASDFNLGMAIRMMLCVHTQ